MVQRPKDRYVIVIAPKDKLPDEEGLDLVAPTSTSSLSEWVVVLPNRTDNPGTSSGLPRPCQAVCDEFTRILPQLLTHKVGDLRKATIRRLQETVLRHIESVR